MKVGVITPIKNEAENLPILLKSVKNQSKVPDEWVIIDDNSNDGSEDIIKKAESETSWITALKRSADSDYDVGFNYSRVISIGFDHLHKNYGDTLDYYMILDGDMNITQNYIQTLCNLLSENKNIKIASCGMYIEEGDEISFVDKIDNQPIGGATVYDGKFYRKIGGPTIAPSVDSVTRAKAESKGWKCCYYRESEEKAIQSRPTGGRGNQFRSGISKGADNYYLCYHPLVAIATGIKQLTESPHYHGMGYLFGYFSNYLLRKPQIEDQQVRQYFYREEPRKILKKVYSF